MNRRKIMGGLAGLTGASAVDFRTAHSRYTTNAWRPGPPLPYAVQEIYPSNVHEYTIVGGFLNDGRGIAATSAVIGLHVPFIPNIADGSLSEDWQDAHWFTHDEAFPHRIHHAHVTQLIWGEPELAETSVVGGYDGGEDGRAWIAQDRVWVSTEAGWREGPRLPKPVGEAVIITRAGQECHLIGGRSPNGEANRAWADQTDIADHFYLPSRRTGRWERLAPLPMARNSAAGGELNSLLHVVSGRTVADGPTAAHHVYDLGEDRWRDAEPYPDPQGGLAACVYADRLYVCGGETFLPRPGVVSAKCYSIGPEGRWRREADMLSPRHGHGLVVFANGVMAVGGATKPGGVETLATTEILAIT